MADTPQTREAWARIQAVQWYHTLDLGNGLRTPGRFDHVPVLHNYHFPERLDGQRCLDVATYDGFWAFEMEKRGASSVTAIDLDRWTDLDLAPSVKQELITSGADGSLGAGFKLAKRVLQSQVQRKVCSVYRLSQGGIGQFDFVFTGDLLLHLAAPVLALQQIRQVTRGEALFVDVYDPDLDGVEGRPVVRYMGGWVLAHWWRPSLECLLAMVREAGFTQVDLLHTFELAEHDGELLHRAVIRARP